MSYISGMVAAVPNDKKDAYTDFCQRVWVLLKEDGAIGGKDCWGADVPDGEVTSFPLAVKKEENETVCFSWIIWPDKETSDACWAKMESDEKWTSLFSGEMPMDGKRMIFGGFEEIAGY